MVTMAQRDSLKIGDIVIRTDEATGRVLPGRINKIIKNTSNGWLLLCTFPMFGVLRGWGRSWLHQIETMPAGW